MSTVTHSLDINGKRHAVQAPGDMPLLWVLRDLLGLTGTKYGCGQALCGACTLHVDDLPVRACVTPVQDVAGKRIVTIEGVPASHPVKLAWAEVNVPQCGYCQPGQIMSACALLAANPRPSRADVDMAMAGNLCRCGTYARIRKAIALASGATR